jgi:hypothetical protein
MPTTEPAPETKVTPEMIWDVRCILAGLNQERDLLDDVAREIAEAVLALV